MRSWNSAISLRCGTLWRQKQNGAADTRRRVNCRLISGGIESIGNGGEFWHCTLLFVSPVSIPSPNGGVALLIAFLRWRADLWTLPGIRNCSPEKATGQARVHGRPSWRGDELRCAGGVLPHGGLYRQLEPKHRTLTQLAHHANRAAVGLDNHLGNSQAHAGAVGSVLLGSAAIELFKNEGLFKAIDTWPTVGYADDNRSPLAFGRDLDSRAFR